MPTDLRTTWIVAEERGNDIVRERVAKHNISSSTHPKRYIVCIKLCIVLRIDPRNVLTSGDQRHGTLTFKRYSGRGPITRCFPWLFESHDNGHHIIYACLDALPNVEGLRHNSFFCCAEGRTKPQYVLQKEIRLKN